MARVILLLGGARSGKSSLAERWARERGGDRVLFVATAEPLDEEMRQRIERHQRSRPSSWRTVEAPTHVGPALAQAYAGEKVVVLDCVTLWVGNVLLQEEARGEENVREVMLQQVDALKQVVDTLPTELILVSNEVGMGVVPPTRLGRLYRDLLGEVNQQLARFADEVYLLVAGLPWRLKPAGGGPGDGT
ncbi:MAG: bifunctional adenosylcobinamide kinase/adenosylcobinamide-phosphate guanylyltransferase [Chloroflexi bacterium]|nr:bifunctional adenosylcobinamide kinase/adenosylcobinamide-phosphate guanylyltransferase [Chloroflexota bacterium]